MNKKSLVVLLVLVLSISGLFAKDLGIKVGGQLGWGFDFGSMKGEVEDACNIFKAKNNGFAFNLTGEYDFDENWGVVANLGMRFAGKTTLVFKQDDEDPQPSKSKENAGLYIDFAVNAKYTYAINEKVSVAGLAGLELLSGHILKSFDEFEDVSTYASEHSDAYFYNVAFGLNLGAEGSYKVTDRISVVGGVSGAWFFVNSSEVIKTHADRYKEEKGKFSAASFYIRPYVGATYSF